MAKKRSVKKKPVVPIEGYDPKNSGIPGTGETAADMFMSIAKKNPATLRAIKSGRIKLLVINS